MEGSLNWNCLTLRTGWRTMHFLQKNSKDTSKCYEIYFDLNHKTLSWNFFLIKLPSWIVCIFSFSCLFLIAIVICFSNLKPHLSSILDRINLIFWQTSPKNLIDILRKFLWVRIYHKQREEEQFFVFYIIRFLAPFDLFLSVAMYFGEKESMSQ